MQYPDSWLMIRWCLKTLSYKEIDSLEGKYFTKFKIYHHLLALHDFNS
jgi:hypothetical protein